MPLLELRDVRKVFRSPDGEDQLILDVPAFQVEEGQQVAIAGTSGSGKTTFLNIIAGLLTPTAGEVRFDGEVVSGLGLDSLAVRDTVEDANMPKIDDFGPSMLVVLHALADDRIATTRSSSAFSTAQYLVYAVTAGID